MFSIRDIQTDDPSEVASFLTKYSKNDQIEIEFPKRSILFNSSRENLHRDLLVATYAHYRLQDFGIVSVEAPELTEHYSFVFTMKANQNDLEGLAETLITLSAGYQNDTLDESAFEDYENELMEFNDEFLSGGWGFASPIADQYRLLIKEWPIEDDDESVDF